MLKNIFLSILAITLIIACNYTEGIDNGPTNDDFNRQGMLINLADNIIIPAYQNLNTKLDLLVSSKDIFISSPNLDNLNLIRSSWLNAYKSWQSVEMINIGKAEEILYHYQMNIYPTDINDIENNIAIGNVDLTHPNNNDAVGFPALDYMLFGLETTDTAIIQKYTSNVDAENYKMYLSDLVMQMKSLTELVLNDWTSSYKDIFTSSSSNSATSGVNMFINDFIFYYEKGLRANKIGIPAGNFSATTLPEKVEAFYNKEVSKILSLEALNAVQDLFNGKTYVGDSSNPSQPSLGSSFNDYLTYLDKSDLASLINDKFDIARQKIQLLDNNFFNQVNTDNVKMTQAYDALQTVVVLLKVDMLQVFNISVDYVDADGD